MDFKVHALPIEAQLAPVNGMVRPRVSMTRCFLDVFDRDDYGMKNFTGD